MPWQAKDKDIVAVRRGDAGLASPADGIPGFTRGADG